MYEANTFVMNTNDRNRWTPGTGSGLTTSRTAHWGILKINTDKTKVLVKHWIIGVGWADFNPLQGSCPSRLWRSLVAPLCYLKRVEISSTNSKYSVFYKHFSFSVLLFNILQWAVLDVVRPDMERPPIPIISVHAMKTLLGDFADSHTAQCLGVIARKCCVSRHAPFLCLGVN